MAKKLKKFKVQAECITYSYIVIEAESEEQANEKARVIDGGEFITVDNEGAWNILGGLTEETSMDLS